MEQSTLNEGEEMKSIDIRLTRVHRNRFNDRIENSTKTLIVRYVVFSFLLFICPAIQSCALLTNYSSENPIFPGIFPGIISGIIDGPLAPSICFAKWLVDKDFFLFLSHFKGSYFVVFNLFIFLHIIVIFLAVIRNIATSSKLLIILLSLYVTSSLLFAFSSAFMAIGTHYEQIDKSFDKYSIIEKMFDIMNQDERMHNKFDYITNIDDRLLAEIASIRSHAEELYDRIPPGTPVWNGPNPIGPMVLIVKLNRDASQKDEERKLQILKIKEKAVIGNIENFKDNMELCNLWKNYEKDRQLEIRSHTIRDNWLKISFLGKLRENVIFATIAFFIAFISYPATVLFFGTIFFSVFCELRKLFPKFA